MKKPNWCLPEQGAGEMGKSGQRYQPPVRESVCPGDVGYSGVTMVGNTVLYI